MRCDRFTNKYALRSFNKKSTFDHLGLVTLANLEMPHEKEQFQRSLTFARVYVLFVAVYAILPCIIISAGLPNDPN